MVCTATPPAVYRPRQPRQSVLCRLINSHYEDFQRVYTQRYQQRYGYWRPAIGEAVRRFLRCGDPAAGFARVRCPDCRHEIFVAFSCRRRCLCPSCHQKRSLIFADQVAHEICAPVPHWQYVFTIPKRLRIFFRFDRRLLGGLMRLAWETIRQAYREALGRDDVVPGVIAGIQTFGALAHLNPHVHTIATDGVFVRDTADSNLPSPPPAQRNRGGEGRLRGQSQFICTPPLDMDHVRRLWEDRVFHLLLEAGKIAGSGSFSCRTPTNDSPTNDNGKKRCLTPSARSQTDIASGNDNPPHIDRRLLEETKTDATPQGAQLGRVDPAGVGS